VNSSYRHVAHWAVSSQLRVLGNANERLEQGFCSSCFHTDFAAALGNFPLQQTLEGLYGVSGIVLLGLLLVVRDNPSSRYASDDLWEHLYFSVIYRTSYPQPRRSHVNYAANACKLLRKRKCCAFHGRRGWHKTRSRRDIDFYIERA
jgi:hypothetical protein